MSSLKFCVLLAVLCSSSQLGHGDIITTPKPYTIVVPQPGPSHNEPVPVLPNVHTDEPAPVVSAETVSVEKKKTTTTTTTTTAAPETTTSTTPAPTTTSAPPTPAPPTPKPGPPEQGSWSWIDKEQNVTCIVIQFAAQFNITAPLGVNETLSDALVNIPINATAVGGLCNKTEQWIQLSWPARNASAANNTLRLEYALNETTKNYELKRLNVTLNPEIFPNANSSAMLELWHGASWRTPLATSYRCGQPSELKLTSISDNTNVAGVLTVSHLQEEAFRTTPSIGFSAARDCSGGDVPDAVPIAVGCALGGLVVVVLIAYLVARRRSAARGYLSM